MSVSDTPNSTCTELSALLKYDSLSSFSQSVHENLQEAIDPRACFILLSCSKVKGFFHFSPGEHRIIAGFPPIDHQVLMFVIPRWLVHWSVIVCGPGCLTALVLLFSVSLCLSVCLSLSLSLSLSLCLSVSLPLSLFFSSPLSYVLYLFLRPLAVLPSPLSLFLSALGILLLYILSVCLPVCLSIYLSIYLNFLFFCFPPHPLSFTLPTHTFSPTGLLHPVTPATVLSPGTPARFLFTPVSSQTFLNHRPQPLLPIP